VSKGYIMSSSCFTSRIFAAPTVASSRYAASIDFVYLHPTQ
jgi:hypothetical protein